MHHYQQVFLIGKQAVYILEVHGEDLTFFQGHDLVVTAYIDFTLKTIDELYGRLMKMDGRVLYSTCLHGNRRAVDIIDFLILEIQDFSYSSHIGYLLLKLYKKIKMTSNVIKKHKIDTKNDGCYAKDRIVR